MHAYQLTSSPTGPARPARHALAHSESPTAMRHGAPDDIHNASPLWAPAVSGGARHVAVPRALLGGGVLLISPHEPTLAAVVADAYVSGQLLRESWAAMVEGWAVGAVALLCGKANAIASDIPPEMIRQSFAQVVHDSLAQDLDRVCCVRLRVEALGLNAPMPPAMQAALANAMQTEIEADAQLDASAEAADMAERDRLLPLLGAPAIDLLQHPILGPLFDALHRSVPIPSVATLASACISTSGDRR